LEQFSTDSQQISEQLPLIEFKKFSIAKTLPPWQELDQKEALLAVLQPLIGIEELFPAQTTITLQRHATQG
jgi:hypothetical protein